MRVLVTGATGFTGGHMARGLKARGYDVVALVRNPAGAADLARDGIDVRLGDLKDERALADAVKDVAIVYNIAAIYREAGLPAAEYEAVNARAVGSLIDAAAAAGVKRVVHCSTVGVHGDVEHPPANENAPLRPGDVYQHSKLRGEEIARERASQSGVELTIVRPSGIYGPGDRRLLKLFRAVARGRFVILGTGRILYHVTFIDDVVEGFRLSGETPAAAGGTYIIAGAEVPTLNELTTLIASEAGVAPPRLRLPVWPVWLAGALCEALCRPFGLEPPLHRRRVDFFTKSRGFDITRARTELGYAPQVTLREGIARTLAWYRLAGWV